MALEIEAKLKVDDLDVVRRRLRERSARMRGLFMETNVFFDTRDRRLLSTDEGLRLRINRDERSRQERSVITFKGPRLAGPLKSREEIELTVDCPTRAVSLLKHLGYARILSFEKLRESWELNGCEVELDTLPLIGTFVEIEGPDEEAVLAVRDLLDLSDVSIIQPSYIALLLAYLQEKGLSTHEIRF